ncbi:acyl-CoA thioesterase domain-containing protein [Variovorax sp. dw_954]|uniref:acyl-CoA thioesterase n=1 Tax=Variovorax sp. dw_954 TaxID=2720078 RepID=UPI001BD2C4BC|nr:acyl-CoA thioesterase domain-containing protein [Variovorax sp. dw_954]
MRAADALPAWNPLDLQALLRLEPVGPSTFRSRQACANARGTVFGGQLLAHALIAASMTVAPDRDATALQFMFLQSADPARPIELEVTPLQDGKRFASRHVRGTQPASGGSAARLVLDAQLTFALELPGPAHATPSRAAGVDPARLPRMEDLPAETSDAVWRTLGYPLDSPALDLRVGDAAQGLGLDAPTASLGFWLRTREPLADDRMLQAAAFAFLSDWWINFASVGVHVRQLERDGERLHVASLNHAIWFHRPLRADQWLYFDVQSPCAGRGRGLSIGAVHDIDGVLVASVSQENLMTPGSI